MAVLFLILFGGITMLFKNIIEDREELDEDDILED